MSESCAEGWRAYKDRKTCKDNHFNHVRASVKLLRLRHTCAVCCQRCAHLYNVALCYVTGTCCKAVSPVVQFSSLARWPLIRLL